MNRTINWGIMGTGQIARKFAKDLKFVSDAKLLGVGSRHKSSADEFGDRFNVPRRYAAYDELASDPEIDVIYIATPHSRHHNNSLLCLSAGKHVLCEKPFTINRRQAEEVIAAAREKNLFLMEAMWSRFVPVYQKVSEWINNGRIGTIRMITADFGFRAPWDADHRLFNPELGGGALMDVGIYTLDLPRWILQKEPKVIKSWAEIGETGVDEQSAYILGYDEGELAVLSSAVRTQTPQEAVIMGTDGSIKIHRPFWNPQKVTITDSGEDTTVSLPIENGLGYQFEAMEVMNCLRKGKSESDIMPLQTTLENMQLLDTIRDQWGLKYPGE